MCHVLKFDRCHVYIYTIKQALYRYVHMYVCGINQETH